MFLKKFLLFFYFLLFFASVIFFYRQTIARLNHSFIGFTGHSPAFFTNLYRHKSPIDSINILVLGTDPRNDWLEQNINTDTIIFVNINIKTGYINLVSLPRDLWDAPTQTKINAFYPLSINQKDPQSFLKSNFSRIIGQPIDKVIVIRTQDLTNFTQIIDYIDVYNDAAFTDYQYPNPKYITQPKIEPIYITVSYPLGWQRLDHETVIPFIRSRKSLANGSDLGRIHRQQLLLSSFSPRLKTSQVLFDLFKLRQFISFYQQLQTDLSLQDTTNIFFSFISTNSSIMFNKIEISTSNNPKETLIYHPATFTSNQWVFLPSDPSLKSLHQFIKNNLK